MTVDDIVSVLYGDYEIYSLSLNKTIYDSFLDGEEDEIITSLMFEEVSSLDLENNKLIINI